MVREPVPCSYIPSSRAFPAPVGMHLYRLILLIHIMTHIRSLLR
jgi:hypothetical protein